MRNSHPHLLKDKRVLLIENNEVNQMLLGYMLRKQGARVATEINRDGVLDYMKNSRPDLILMDTSMDDVNALSFTRQMRDKMDIQIPIIGMSTTDLRGRGIYHGLDHVIRKPVQYRELQQILRKLGFRES